MPFKLKNTATLIYEGTKTIYSNTSIVISPVIRYNTKCQDCSVPYWRI